jgi:hypothetical protein
MKSDDWWEINNYNDDDWAILIIIILVSVFGCCSICGLMWCVCGRETAPEPAPAYNPGSMV